MIWTQNPWLEDYNSQILSDTFIKKTDDSAVETWESEIWESIPLLNKDKSFKETEFCFIDGIIDKDKDYSTFIDGDLIQLSIYNIASGAIICRLGEVNTFLLGENFFFLKKKVLSFNKEAKPYAQKILESLKNNPEVLRNNLEAPLEIIFEELGNTENLHLIRESLEQEMLDFIVSHFKDNTQNKIILKDGPLSFPKKESSIPVVGFVKQFSHLYPNKEDFSLWSDLEVQKNRSCLFKIKNQILSSYIKLVEVDHIAWYNSLLRLDIIEGKKEQVVELVDFLAYTLPLFSYHFSKRYPQNLGPVEKLEKELRLILGNSLLMTKNL